jgi:hypothetical protein
MKHWFNVQGSMFKVSELIQSGPEVFLTLNLEHLNFEPATRVAERLERALSMIYSRAGLRRNLCRRFNTPSRKEIAKRCSTPSLTVCSWFSSGKRSA